MDALNPNYKNNNEAAYPNEAKTPAPGGFLNFFRAVTPQSANVTPSAAEVVPAQAVSSPAYQEDAPVYKGSYSKLCPLAFDTRQVDNSEDTRLDRCQLAEFGRAQLFFLLRLERFLRLRHHWLEASPRQDETWKTNLVMRGIFSAMRDCQTHGVGPVAVQLVRDWGCC